MKKIIVLMVLAFVGITCFAGYDINSQVLPEASALYNHLNSNVSMANELKDNVDLVRSTGLYQGLGPAEMVTSAGAVQEVLTATGASSAVVMVTAECVVGGILKHLNATSEVFAFKSGTDLNPNKAAVYLFSSDGSAVTSITVTKGTEVDSTEVATCPAVPSGEAAFALIRLSAMNTFEVGTTNFNAPGVNATVETLVGTIYEGTSSPAAMTATDLSLINQ